MLRSKLFWALFFICFAIGAVLGYLFIGHSVPGTARYIPADISGVLTLQTKRLGADILLGGKLNTDTSLASNKIYQRWKKISAENGGIGISFTSDVLIFQTQSREHQQWYTGMVVKVDDELKLKIFLQTKFTQLLDTAQVHLSALVASPGYSSLVLIDDDWRSPVGIGFNHDVMVVLTACYEVRDNSFFNPELKRIFNMPKDSSILSNKVFRESEKQSADVSLWINLNAPAIKDLLGTKPGQNSKEGFLQAFLDFNKGEINLRVGHLSEDLPGKNVFGKPASNSSFSNYVDTARFMGMLSTHVDLQTLFERIRSEGHGSRLDLVCNKWGLSPDDISGSFDGNADLALNGFVHFNEKYIAYEYDDNFNQVEVPHDREARIPGFVLRLGINGPQAMTLLLPKLLASKTITVCQNGFRLNSELPVYFHPMGPQLFISSSEEMPIARERGPIEGIVLKKFPVTDGSWAYIDLKGTAQCIHTEFSNKPDMHPFAGVFNRILIAIEEQEPGKTNCNIRVGCTNPSTNSLVSLLNLMLDLNHR